MARVIGLVCVLVATFGPALCEQPVLGVPRAEWASYYAQGDNFRCKDGVGSVPIAQLNGARTRTRTQPSARSRSWRACIVAAATAAAAAERMPLTRRD